MAVDGGDGDGVAQAQVVELVHVRVGGRRRESALFTASTTGFLERKQHIGHLLVGGGDAGAGCRTPSTMTVGVVNGDLRLARA